MNSCGFGQVSGLVLICREVWHCHSNWQCSETMFGITPIHTSLVTPLCCCLVISVLCFIRTGDIASGIYHPQWKWESEGKSLWLTMHHLNVRWLSPMKKNKWNSVIFSMSCTIPGTFICVLRQGKWMALCSWLIGRHGLWTEHTVIQQTLPWSLYLLQGFAFLVW